jgi:AcrR family transcriptional regulator
VATAVGIADAEGLAAVSMRRVAAELGAAPMSLYRHVIDKDALLLLMMDAAFAGAALPATPPEAWRDRLELATRTMWGLFRRHPWLASALSLTRPQLITSAIPYTEWVLSALDGRGLKLQTIFTVYLALLNYVRGTAINLEMEAEAEALTGLDVEEWMQAHEPQYQAMLDSERFPTFARLLTQEYDFDIDGLFEFGLQRLLDGVALLVGAVDAD